MHKLIRSINNSGSKNHYFPMPFSGTSMFVVTPPQIHQYQLRWQRWRGRLMVVWSQNWYNNIITNIQCSPPILRVFACFSSRLWEDDPLTWHQLQQTQQNTNLLWSLPKWREKKLFECIGENVFNMILLLLTIVSCWDRMCTKLSSKIFMAVKVNESKMCCAFLFFPSACGNH